MTKRLFCFGLGYTALAFIDHLKEQEKDWHFSGTCRDPGKCQELKKHNIDGFTFNSEQPEEGDIKAIRQALKKASHILISIAPTKDQADPILSHFSEDMSKNLHQNIKWLAYLSTTGVYGDHKGGWVGENTPLTPGTKRGKMRLEAESDWLKLFQEKGLPVHIFRLGSIYGAGRGQLHSLRKGRLQKLVKPGQYFSRIHVSDIAHVLFASLNSPHAGRCYNVVDDLPAPSQEVIDYICDLLHRPHLPEIDFDNADISPMMKSFYSENKRVCNDRIRQELNVKLLYPTYKEGFSHLIKNIG